MDKIKAIAFATAASTIIDSLVDEVSSNTDLQKLLFGKYTDGSPRNLADALEGEVYSPKQKQKFDKKHKKNKKKKKKKNKKGEKYAKIDLSLL